MKTSKFIALSPVQSPDPKMKEWLIYDRNTLVTSAIKYLYTNSKGQHHLAVGRSFCSYKDEWVKKIGRTKALKRLRKNYERSYGVELSLISERNGDQIITFQSGSSEILTTLERMVFEKSIRGMIERWEAGPDSTEIKLSSIVDWKTDKYVQEMVGSAN